MTLKQFVKKQKPENTFSPCLQTFPSLAGWHNLVSPSREPVFSGAHLFPNACFAGYVSQRTLPLILYTYNHLTF